MPEKPIPPGKLPHAMLNRLLAEYAKPGEGVVLGPGIGEDAAVLDPGLADEYLLAKTDPITFVAADIGSYALTINANDIACMGGTPRWFLAAVILPSGSADEPMVESIFASLSESCAALGVSLVGGHTEVTHGLDRPIVVGNLIGTVKKDSLVTTSGAKPGDKIILTKGIPIEAVSIIARERREELLAIYHEEFVDRLAGYFTDPGVSVVRDAAIATGAGRVNCMHDPTEGGLSSGLYEIAAAAGVGLEVDASAIRVLPEAFELIGRYGLDPLGCIASGALVITAAPAEAEKIVAALEADGIYASIIGQITDKSNSVMLKRGGKLTKLPLFVSDEITKIFSS